MQPQLSNHYKTRHLFVCLMKSFHRKKQDDQSKQQKPRPKRSETGDTVKEHHM